MVLASMLASLFLSPLPSLLGRAEYLACGAMVLRNAAVQIEQDRPCRPRRLESSLLRLVAPRQHCRAPRVRLRTGLRRARVAPRLRCVTSAGKRQAGLLRHREVSPVRCQRCLLFVVWGVLHQRRHQQKNRSNAPSNPEGSSGLMLEIPPSHPRRGWRRRAASAGARRDRPEDRRRAVHRRPAAIREGN